jgi:hypothetical protein
LSVTFLAAIPGEEFGSHCQNITSLLRDLVVTRSSLHRARKLVKETFDQRMVPILSISFAPRFPDEIPEAVATVGGPHNFLTGPPKAAVRGQIRGFLDGGFAVVELGPPYVEPGTTIDAESITTARRTAIITRD